ncbi:hypothetical protein [Halapricum desulfuricans]|uniref:Uncharacterized protein n=1 Tax=Halapricum desulfuricans TaxID=2841257 RepID=A0A897N9H1_9EURY|nr:hypothetical protein [Halapricum desulfuricans]QSG08948.1 hypothetical protein HSR122_1557 [Halapricum desulfuricans]
MSERTRREYLKDFGIAAGVVGAAGCLGGGEDEETPTNTATDTPETTSSDPTTEENTTEGEETTEEETTTETSQDLEGYGLDMLTWIPETRNQDIANFIYARPSDIAEDIGAQAVSEYDDQGVFSPQYWTDIGMEQVSEGLAAWPATIWVVDEDVTKELEESFGSAEEYNGFDIYQGTEELSDGEEGDFVIAYDGEIVVEGLGASLPENYSEETIIPIVETIQSENPTSLVDGTPILDGLSKRDISDGFDIYLEENVRGSSPISESEGRYPGANFDYQSEGVEVDNFVIESNGQITETEEDVRGIGMPDDTYDLGHLGVKLF